MPEELSKKSEFKTYQPTPEQIERWKRIDELERGATVGFSTPEQDDKNVKEFLENDYIETQLERLRAHRKKLIKKLKWTEEYEEFLLREKNKGS